MSKIHIRLLITFVVSLVLIVWPMPRAKRFGYTYELGKPWNYAALIAPFDFDVHKDADRYQHELDSVKAGLRQYFVEADTTVGISKARQFRKAASSVAYFTLPSKYKEEVASRLQEYYEQGIVSPEQMENLRSGHYSKVCVVRGSTKVERLVSQLHTPQSAYEHILKNDTPSLHRLFLSNVEFSKYLQPNLEYARELTEVERSDALAKVSDNLGKVLEGQKIVDRGDIVDADLVAKLNSYRAELEQRATADHGNVYMLLGQIGVVCTILGLMVVYLRLYRRDVMNSPNKLSMLFALTALFPFCTGVMMSHHFLSVYLLPYAMAPIVTRVFIDSRTATMQLLIILLASSLTLHSSYIFITSELIAGLTAIYALREIHARSQVFRAAFLVTIAAVVSEVLISFVQGQRIDTLDYSNIIYKLVSGVLLLFTYPLMYIVERVFSLTSDVTLIELTNINHPLLRRMSKEAQGTFIHSMQVANLAAEVANKIGGNSQLVRTGALYHDIGKIQSPAFFTENQSGMNPHDQLKEEESASIIMSHVSEGLRLAERHGLPTVIRDFIATHHGKSRVGYFYIQAVNSRGEDNVNPADFTYPGRSPFTREQAILMMTDAVEAASRSLKEYTEESIHDLVDKIIDGQLAAGHFKDCPINFRDVTQAKAVLCDSLKTIYHTRIAYPDKQK